MKIVKLFFLITSVTLAGCATMKKIDESYTSQTPGFSKAYSFSKPQCVENVKKAFKDMGTNVEEVKGEKVISDRWEFMRTAEAVSSNSQYSSYATATQYSIAAKLYVDVKDSGKNQCEVSLSKIRAWENTSEYEEINVAQAKQKIVDPFFKNLDERMVR